MEETHADLWLRLGTFDTWSFGLDDHVEDGDEDETSKRDDDTADDRIVERVIKIVCHWPIHIWNITNRQNQTQPLKTYECLNIALWLILNIKKQTLNN